MFRALGIPTPDMLFSEKPTTVDIDALAFFRTETNTGCAPLRRGELTMYCTTYADSGNPRHIIVIGPGIHDVYEYPNDSFSNGRQCHRDGTYGKIVSRSFIF